MIIKGTMNLKIIQQIRYIWPDVIRVVGRGGEMIDGFLVNLERYAPRWTIRYVFWGLLLTLGFQIVYGTHDFLVWLITPLAKQGFIGEEYDEALRWLSAATSLTVLGLLGFLLLKRLAIRWRLYKDDDPFPDEASLKKAYLSMLEHAELYHEETWNEIVDELNEKRKHIND